MADTFTGEPGFSAPVYEVDFAPRKPRCDVLLLGSAYAPGGRPVDARARSGCASGRWRRRSTSSATASGSAASPASRASAPQPFTAMPISYDVAFGGADQQQRDPAEHDAYLANPVGRGLHKH